MLKTFCFLWCILSIPILSLATTKDADICSQAALKNDYETAYPACLKAAETGHATSQILLGLMYDQGKGVKADFSLAEKWYSKAENGGETARALLAFRYYDRAEMFAQGKGVAKNEVEAEKWFLKSAEFGNATAQHRLGILNQLEKRYVEAAKWYLLAAEQGDPDSQENLGWLYKNGNGVKQDYIEAKKWFLRAANQGHTSSQTQLGDLYYNGLGVKKEFTTAVYWYKKAAAQGDDDAQNNLGAMYRDGEGVPKNYFEAVKLFQKSAEKGNSGGQWNLGAAYFNGEGITQDRVQGLAWLTLAAASNANAVKSRDDVEKILNPNEIAQAQQLAARVKAEIDKREEKRYLTNINEETHSKQTAIVLFSTHSLPATTKPAFSANDIAVIIGIEKYRSVPSTEYASADAGMVRDYLKALGIQARNIEFLSDDRATLSDIRKVIETKLPNMVKSSSRVIVYYAGHGAPGTTQGESYLVPYDGDPSFLADTAYPLSRLYDRLSRLKAKEVLVLLDSCFSGAGGRSVLAKGARPLVMVKDTAPPASKKMIVLTSSRGSQITTSLPEVGHGAFTYFFLRALQEGSRDIGEVYAYLERRVADEAKRQNVDQTPTVSPSADKLKGRFLFAK